MVERVGGTRVRIKASGEGDVATTEVFLYLQREQTFRTMKACVEALADFKQADFPRISNHVGLLDIRFK